MLFTPISSFSTIGGHWVFLKIHKLPNFTTYHLPKLIYLLWKKSKRGSKQLLKQKYVSFRSSKEIYRDNDAIFARFGQISIKQNSIVYIFIVLST